MDRPQRMLSVQKLDVILDEGNRPILISDFAKKLEKDLRLRDLYLYNIEFWMVYFHKQLAQKSIDLKLIEVKLSELLQLARLFPKEKWPKLYYSIGKLEKLTADNTAGYAQQKSL